jgi:hypothetical protein
MIGVANIFDLRQIIVYCWYPNVDSMDITTVACRSTDEFMLESIDTAGFSLYGHFCNLANFSYSIGYDI